MIVYWAGCIASMLIAYLGTSRMQNGKNSGLVIFFSALPLILIAALRYDVGADYLNSYVVYFKQVLNNMMNDANRLEPLYHLLNQIVAWFQGDYVWIFTATAVIFFVAVYAQIFQDSPYPALSVFLLVGMGYMFVFFNGMRQLVGCSLLMFSIRYIRRRRFLPFLICVALATGFHDSCVVFIVSYWLAKIRIRPIAAFVLTTALVVLIGPVTELLHYLISQTPYAIYFASIFDTGETAYVMLAINLVLLIFASLYYDADEKYRTYYNFQLIALWTTIFSGRIVLMLRMLWVFGLPSIILVPIVLEKIPRDKDRKLIAAAIIVMYVIYTLYTVGMQNSNSVLPYQTIFSRWI